MQTVRDIALAVKEIILEHGWSETRWISDTGSRCFLAAVAETQVEPDAELIEELGIERYHRRHWFSLDGDENGETTFFNHFEDDSEKSLFEFLYEFYNIVLEEYNGRNYMPIRYHQLSIRHPHIKSWEDLIEYEDDVSQPSALFIYDLLYGLLWANGGVFKRGQTLIEILDKIGTNSGEEKDKKSGSDRGTTD